jgi:hypothetical protein
LAPGAAALVASVAMGGEGGGGGNRSGPLATTTIALQQSGNQWSLTVTARSSGRNPSATVSPLVGGSDNLTSAVSAGLANFIISPSPMVGIHICDDWYAADAQNESSESGAQMETFT